MTAMTVQDLEKEFGGIERELGTPVAVSALYLPSAVRLEREEIICRYTVSFSDRDVTPSARILNDFLNLREGSDRDVLRFVERYGPLFLCEEHKLPWARTHFLRYEHCLRREVGPYIALDRSGTSEVEIAEPVEPYKNFAKEAFKLLWCALELRKGIQPKIHEWPNARGDPLAESLNGYYRLTKHLNWWLETAGLEPCAVTRGYPPKGVRFELVTDAHNPLFAVIALQLNGAVCSGLGTSICAECGCIFTAHRKGTKYCGRDGLRASWRRASAKSRRNKRKRLGKLKR